MYDTQKRQVCIYSSNSDRDILWSQSILDRLYVTAIAMRDKYQHYWNKAAWHLFGISLKVHIFYYSIIVKREWTNSLSEKRWGLMLPAHEAT